MDPVEQEVEAAYGEPIELTMLASDPDGDLNWILWFRTPCDDPVGSTDVGGVEAEVTRTVTAGGCGIQAWIVDDRGAMRNFGGWYFEDASDEG